MEQLVEGGYYRIELVASESYKESFYLGHFRSMNAAGTLVFDDVKVHRGPHTRPETKKMLSDNIVNAKDNNSIQIAPRGKYNRLRVIPYQGTYATLPHDYEVKNIMKITYAVKYPDSEDEFFESLDFFDLVEERGPQKEVIFSINGNRIAVPFYVGNNKIVLKPTKFHVLNCVDILIESNEIILVNFYFYLERHKCPQISHAEFFKLLDAISAVAHKPIVLTDASTKQVREGKNCNFPNFVMAVAKDVSFYNRFGFQNARFTEDLRKTQQIKLSTLQQGGLSELYKTISKTTSDIDISLKEAAQYALDNCHHNTPEMQEFIISLTEELESLIPENSSFKRPRSTSVYEVNVDEEQDHFVVEFTEEEEAGTKRQKEHATGTGGRRQRSRKFRRSFRRFRRSFRRS
jgi:hypothetical protein